MRWAGWAAWEGQGKRLMGTPPAPHSEAAVGPAASQRLHRGTGTALAPVSTPSLIGFLGRRGQPGEGHLEPHISCS